MRPYCETMNRYYNLKLDGIRKILKIPENEKIDNVFFMYERVVVTTRESIRDTRNIK